MKDVIAIARLFRFVRETSQNQGQRVNAIQTWSGGADALGTSWCAWFVTMVLDLAYQGKSPIPRMGSVQAIRDLAQSHGWVVNVPQVGDLFLYINAENHAHHIGFVSNLEPLSGIAGNTSSDGTSSNGDGVYDHPISAHTFIHLVAP
jgi:hypothetical protein